MNAEPSLYAPSAMEELSDEAVVEYFFSATPLGDFILLPSVRRAIAEDRVLQTARQLAQLPDFMSGEVHAIAAWRDQQPHLFEHYLQQAKADLAAFAPFDGAISKFRLDVRVSTFRRLSVLWFGRENYIPSPELAGEPYIEIEVPGHPDLLKIGRVAMASWTNDEKLEPQFHLFCQNDNWAVVRLVERILVPEATSSGDVGQWADIWKERQAVSELRRFEATSRHPAFPSAGLNFDPRAVPESHVIRPALEELIAGGNDVGVFGLLRALEITPFLSTAAIKYLAAKENQVVALAVDHNLAKEHLLRSAGVRELVAKLRQIQTGASVG